MLDSSSISPHITTSYFTNTFGAPSPSSAEKESFYIIGNGVIRVVDIVRVVLLTTNICTSMSVSQELMTRMGMS